jgi:ArsR family transcriptional regulator
VGRCLSRNECFLKKSWHYLAKPPNKGRLSHTLIHEARAAVIKALAHPSRVLLVDALEAGKRCVGELTGLVGADISTVSKHLAILKDAGIVEAEKRGLNQYYRLRCQCLGEFFRCVDLLASTTVVEPCCRNEEGSHATDAKNAKEGCVPLRPPRPLVRLFH